MNRRRFLKNSAGIFIPAAFGILKARGDVMWRRWNSNAAPATSSVTYLINEGFESGSIPSGWTNPVGVINWGYTATVLAGTKSAEANSGDAEGLKTFTAGGTVEGFCLFRTSGTMASDAYVFFFEDASANILCVGVIDHTTKKMTVNSLTNVGSTTVSTVTSGTTYGLWLRYVKGTGANAFCSAEFQPSPFTRVGSGNNYCQVTTGVATANASQVRIITVDSSQTVIWDTVLVAANQTIPSNPP